MDEVLVIVAGAAKLDLNVRILLDASDFYSKLRNVTGDIETLKNDMQLLIDMLWVINHDFDEPVNQRSKPLHVAHHPTKIPHDEMKEVGMPLWSQYSAQCWKKPTMPACT
ncbi:hypothetical protein F66182_6097 [Fusarium sp. NRRL 66182]|nr:hypothetical protein F66182_6097 [Fusarium sp. NRRL 66182]